MSYNDILTQFYPEESYNFNATPIGPLRTLLVASGELIQDAQTAITGFTEQIVLATATGAYLRNIAPFYGITPNPSESDSSLRARCQAALNAPKITPVAIQALVSQWFVANGTPPLPVSVAVIDLQNDPVIAGDFGLIPGQFLVLLNFEDDCSILAFADYCYCDYSYASEGSYRPPGALRKLLEQQWKAAAYQDIWWAGITCMPTPATGEFIADYQSTSFFSADRFFITSGGTFAVDVAAGAIFDFALNDGANILEVNVDTGTMQVIDTASLSGNATTPTFNVSDASTMSFQGSSVTNVGGSTVNLSLAGTGSTFTVEGTANATFGTSVGCTVTVGNGQTGALDLKGTFSIENGTLIIGTTVAGSLTVEASASLTINNATLHLDGAYDFTGTKTLNDAASITTPNGAVIGDFNAVPTGLTVAFTDTSIDDGSHGAPASWAWDFGDSLGTSTSQNPSYTYGSANTYNVTLVTTTSGGRTSTCVIPVTVT